MDDPTFGATARVSDRSLRGYWERDSDHWARICSGNYQWGDFVLKGTRRPQVNPRADPWVEVDPWIPQFRIQGEWGGWQQSKHYPDSGRLTSQSHLNPPHTVNSTSQVILTRKFFWGSHLWRNTISPTNSINLASQRRNHLSKSGCF